MTNAIYQAARCREIARVAMLDRDLTTAEFAENEARRWLSIAIALMGGTQ
jgi:hypothetical protein